MPAFFELEFWNLENPELWVAVGLIAFLAIAWVAGAFRLAAGMLDGKASKIQTDLDEAANLRAEAEAMLADIRRQREETEVQAAQMLADAEAEAKRLESEAKVRLEDQIARRKVLAERRIATAESQAAADVKAAAADLASQMAEMVLAERLAGAKTDPAADAAIAQIADRLQ